MAGKIQNVLYLEIVAWKAQPAPPLGPMLWANGVNIGAFTKEFNDKTQPFMQQFAWADVKIKCKLTIYSDRTFATEILWPVTSTLILRKAKIKKWSGEPNKQKVWSISQADLEEIAEIKKEDMNTEDVNSIKAAIAGTAKSMGIEVK